MPGEFEVEMLPRLCHVADADEAAIRRAADLGFNAVIVGGGAVAKNGDMQAFAESCASRKLDLFFDVDFSEWDLHDELVQRHPHCFAIRREPDSGVVDPRSPGRSYGRAWLRNSEDLAPILDWGEAHLGHAITAGAKGFRAIHPDGAGARVWEHCIGRARESSNRELTLIADATGLPRENLAALENRGFDFTLSSLPWWDGRANWLIEEHEALSRIAPVIAQVDSPTKIPPASLTARRTRLVLAALSGTGLLMPLRFAGDAVDDGDAAELDAFIRSINRIRAKFC
jgi:starch synthase (maltosyl-transferring)